MADRYPKSKGGAWPDRNRTHDKQPHFRGHIEITGDQIKELIAMHKDGQEMRLQIGIWKSVAQKTGQKWLSISAEAYRKQNDRPTSGPVPDDGEIPF